MTLCLEVWLKLMLTMSLNLSGEQQPLFSLMFYLLRIVFSLIGYSVSNVEH